jgi:glutathione S-transferase
VRACRCPKRLEPVAFSMTTLPILYSFRRCPYAMRARLALFVSGQVCELREVVLGHKPPALLEASAKGTVPVLVLADGEVIDQSLDIMLWALRRHDPRHWWPTDDNAQAQMLALVATCDGEFKHHLDRYKYPQRFGLTDATPHRKQGAQWLNDLNRRLLAKPFLTGETESLADAAIAPFVRQFAHTDPTWFAGQPWPALQTWLMAFENSASYQLAMTKYAPWQAGQTPMLLPATHSATT